MPSIYGLYDSSGCLRYIGKANNPAARLKGHMREIGRRRTPLYDWLKKHGLPEMRVLRADCEDWKAAERELIAEARSRGERLLNIADGGDEPHCPPETRSRNAIALNARLAGDERARKIRNMKRILSTALRSGLVPEHTKQKMRLAAAIAPKTFGNWAHI